jgi:hypothetical protein
MHCWMSLQTLMRFPDYGWTGWVPSPDNFCFDVLPKLESAGITVPNEVVNGKP